MTTTATAAFPALWMTWERTEDLENPGYYYWARVPVMDLFQ